MAFEGSQRLKNRPPLLAEWLVSKLSPLVLTLPTTYKWIEVPVAAELWHWERSPLITNICCIDLIGEKRTTGHPPWIWKITIPLKRHYNYRLLCEAESRNDAITRCSHDPSCISLHSAFHFDSFEDGVWVWQPTTRGSVGWDGYYTLIAWEQHECMDILQVYTTDWYQIN